MKPKVVMLVRDLPDLLPGVLARVCRVGLQVIDPAIGDRQRQTARRDVFSGLPDRARLGYSSHRNRSLLSGRRVPLDLDPAPETDRRDKDRGWQLGRFAVAAAKPSACRPITAIRAHSRK